MDGKGGVTIAGKGRWTVKEASPSPGRGLTG